LRLAALAALALILASRGVAEAGHVVGLGLYRYDPSRARPQLRLSQRVDDLRFDVSGYPADPAPGEAVDFRVTVEGGAVSAAPVACTVHRVGLLGGRRRVVEWQTAAGASALEGSHFRFTLPEEAEYEVTFAASSGLTPSSMLSFQMVVGRPGSPWMILAGFAGVWGLFISGVVAAGRARERRAALAGTA